MPKTTLGKWSVGLHSLFLVAIITSVALVKILGVLNFDDRWWDITAAIAFLASIIALICGIIAKKKYQDASPAVLFSIILGLGVILFILFHSLFIAD